MARPLTLRDRMKDAVQLGIPDPLASSKRPPTATPTEARLALAEELLRSGATIGAVAEETGLSRYLVRVVANCRLRDWHFVVPSEDWELAEKHEREAAKWQARAIRQKASQ
jgi:hypothetical protein